MRELIQIVYISRSTFIASESSSGIEPNVARILMKSRMNNKKNGLVGVLYFGDGCFFQCLEGTKEAVESLYAKLLQDPRHTDLKIISRKAINSFSFADWAMKYVPLDLPMKRLLNKYGFKDFNPYLFDDDMNSRVLALLHQTNEGLLLEALDTKEAKDENPATPLFNYALALSLGVIAFFGGLILLQLFK